MDKSPHSYLAFNGAEEFAKQQGVEMVDNDYFITEDNIGMLKLAEEANSILVTYWCASFFLRMNIKLDKKYEWRRRFVPTVGWILRIKLQGELHGHWTHLQNILWII